MTDHAPSIQEAAPRYALICNRCGYIIEGEDPKALVKEAEELHQCEETRI